MKSGIVAIVGRPSAGKSTLMNALCGQKIAITSPIPQTTRNKIRGILNTEEGQLVFIDTPGYHHSEKKMNLVLTDLVHSSLGDAEAVLYVTDSTREPGKEEEEIVGILRNIRAPLIIALNKTDLNSPQSQHVYDFLSGHFPEQPVIKVSAVTKSGFGPLIDALYKAVPEDHPLYPDDYYTDQTPEFRITEIVREKAFQRLRQEIPHSLYVEVADLEMKTLPSGKEKLWARTFLVVEKESQKGMVIGKHAATIKEIRISAEKELNRIFPYRVHLDLRVKVNKKWRKKDQLIQGMFR